MDYLFRQGDKSFYFGALYFSVAVQIFVLIGLLLILAKLEEIKKKTLTVVYYTVRVLSFYALLLLTVAPLPFSQVFVQSIICQEEDPLRGNDDCYTGVHLSNMIAGVIGMVFLVLFSFLTQLLFIDSNPSTNIPFGCSQSKIGLFKLVLKLCMPIYVVLDYDVRDEKWNSQAYLLFSFH